MRLVLRFSEGSHDLPALAGDGSDLLTKMITQIGPTDEADTETGGIADSDSFDASIVYSLQSSSHLSRTLKPSKDSAMVIPHLSWDLQADHHQLPVPVSSAVEELEKKVTLLDVSSCLH